MYLRQYCENFNLAINGSLILNDKKEVVGHIEPDRKYVKFHNQGSLIKISDLFLLTFENLSVH